MFEHATAPGSIATSALSLHETLNFIFYHSALSVHSSRSETSIVVLITGQNKKNQPFGIQNRKTSYTSSYLLKTKRQKRRRTH